MSREWNSRAPSPYLGRGCFNGIEDHPTVRARQCRQRGYPLPPCCWLPAQARPWRSGRPNCLPWATTGRCPVRFASEWVAGEGPKARSAWVPDMSQLGDNYQRCHSRSSFGVNDSAIALATNTTLDRNQPDQNGGRPTAGRAPGSTTSTPRIPTLSSKSATTSGSAGAASRCRASICRQRSAPPAILRRGEVCQVDPRSRAPATPQRRSGSNHLHQSVYCVLCQEWDPPLRSSSELIQIDGRGQKAADSRRNMAKSASKKCSMGVDLAGRWSQAR